MVSTRAVDGRRRGRARRRTRVAELALADARRRRRRATSIEPMSCRSCASSSERKKGTRSRDKRRRRAAQARQWPCRRPRRRRHPRACRARGAQLAPSGSAAALRGQGRRAALRERRLARVRQRALEPTRWRSRRASSSATICRGRKNASCPRLGRAPPARRRPSPDRDVELPEEPEAGGRAGRGVAVDALRFTLLAGASA